MSKKAKKQSQPKENQLERLASKVSGLNGAVDAVRSKQDALRKERDQIEDEINKEIEAFTELRNKLQDQLSGAVAELEAALSRL